MLKVDKLLGVLRESDKPEEADLLQLGETSVTAYPGDKGKTAFDHSQSAHAPTNAQKNDTIPLAAMAPAADQLIPSGYAGYIPESYEIADNTALEIADNAVLEIG